MSAADDKYNASAKGRARGRRYNATRNGFHHRFMYYMTVTYRKRLEERIAVQTEHMAELGADFLALGGTEAELAAILHWDRDTARARAVRP